MTEIRVTIAVEVDGGVTGNGSHPAALTYEYSKSEQDNPRFYSQNVEEAVREAAQRAVESLRSHAALADVATTVRRPKEYP